jgi:hypothetical protein
MGIRVNASVLYYQGLWPPLALQDWKARVLSPDETTMAKDVKFLYGWSERRLAEELQVNF